MDVQLEKAAIIERLQKVNDESLISAFKNLLDFALNRSETDELIEASINRGLAQSVKGESRPHNEVMAEMREKYSA